MSTDEPGSAATSSGGLRSDPQALGESYRQVRAWTERLAQPLSPEDCVVQSMPDASPVKWHLAHTSWFFETFVLGPAGGYTPYHPRYSYLFNSYYNAVGERHPRPVRGMLTRPSLADVYAYREVVDDAMQDRIGRGMPAELAAVAELGLHHEQQHQELIVTDLKHLLAGNPLRPEYRDDAAPPGDAPAAPLRWLRFAEGVYEVGRPAGGSFSASVSASDSFCFDNETPRHRAFLNAFELASRPASCGEYLLFMADGGYQRPELWLSEGWDVVQREGWDAPLYWEQGGAGWMTYTLGGMRRVAANEPVCHLSYYEADAFARWSGARLPTEAEWETAAVADCESPSAEGTFLESERFHPAPAAEGEAPVQMLGDVWEWTASPYAAYPGYRAAAGALGEYNGKFMCSQVVLRGGSCATPRSHIRPTYRNFFPPPARWQFSGLRLARDAAS